MKGNKRRLLCASLALTMALSLAAPAMAAEGAASGILDLEPGAWYTNPVIWAASNRLAQEVQGIGETCTKAEALLLTWRAAGEGEGSFEEALAWLNGRSEIGFSIEDFQGDGTRLDFVHMLYLALGQGELAPDVSFSDLTAEELAQMPLSAEAVNWAVAKGITNGTGPDTFSPQALLTREQVVTMLYRWRMAADGYITRPTPIFRETMTDELAQLRFYADAPNVPYMGIGDYYALMLPGAAMEVAKDGHSYTLTSQTGTATVDTEKDTFTSSDLNAFTNLMDQVQKGMPNVYADGVRYVTVLGADYDKPADTVTFDFAKYGIDIHDGDRDVYFPLATLSDMYSDLFYHVASFNGTNVYVNDDNHYDSDYKRDPHFYDVLLSGADRPADMVEFSYNELCFAVDHFFGFPGRAPVEEALAQKGLDAALTESYPEIKAMLNSPDAIEYLVGQFKLSVGPLFDGGHTGFFAASQVMEALPEEAAAFTEKMMEYGFGEALLAMRDAAFNNPGMDEAGMTEARNASYGEGETYIKKGDTVVFVLNDFTTIDFKGWENYVNGTGPRPTGETDDYVRFVEALERAEADPEVKNFVVDITMNGGGSLDELAAMTDQMIGASEMRFYDPLTHQVVTERYAVDRNLDGKIDEADKLVKHDTLNYAVLTSNYCFSCGNLFPSVLRDHGIMTLGYQTRGGSCAVQKHSFADGFGYQISSHHGRLINAAGENIDGGVPVDVELLKTNEDGTEDYTAFYDIDLLSEAIHAFYGDTQDAAA